jgi:hypothetical protein
VIVQIFPHRDTSHAKRCSNSVIHGKLMDWSTCYHRWLILFFDKESTWISTQSLVGSASASAAYKLGRGFDSRTGRIYSERIRFVLERALFILSCLLFSRRFRDDKTLAVTVPSIKPLESTKWKMGK